MVPFRVFRETLYNHSVIAEKESSVVSTMFFSRFGILFSFFGDIGLDGI